VPVDAGARPVETSSTAAASNSSSFTINELSPHEQPAVTGKLLVKFILRTLRQDGSAALNHCYEEGLRTHPDLRGQIRTKLVIAPNGTVQQATDDGSTLADAPIRECFDRVLRSLKFDPPEDGGTASFVAGFDLVPEPPPHRGPLGLVSVGEITMRGAGLASPDRTITMLRSTSARRCYRETLSVNPTVEGALTVSASVAHTGIVEAVSVTSASATLPAELIQCVVAAVTKTDFKPHDGGPATVAFSLGFSIPR
jgi:hypothetical protein